MFSIGNEKKKPIKKKQRQRDCVERQFPCITWSAIQHACGRHDPRSLTRNGEGVAAGRGSAVPGRSLSREQQIWVLHHLKSVRSRKPTAPEWIYHAMARGEGAEQCAATLLSVKAVSVESRSTTVRFLMNEPRMPLRHTHISHVCRPV